MKGYAWILPSLLGALGGLAQPSLAASEQAIRECQAHMNPLVVSQCVAKLKSKTNRLEEIECRKDLECWGERYSESADKHCATGFSRAAHWDARWWTIWNEEALTHVRWRSRGEGILEYYLDNGGMRLVCAFNPQMPQKVQVQYGPALGEAGLEL